MSISNLVKIPVLEKTNMGYMWNTLNNNFIHQNINQYKDTTEGINIILLGRTWMNIATS